jgi:CHASE3 domain sensor protein
VSRQGARVLLVVSCLVAAAAIFQSVRFSQSHRDQRTHVLDVERDTGALLVALTELRGAQMAYLATGQGPDFWMRRTTELAGQLQDGIARLRGVLTAPAAVSRLDTAAVAVGDLIALDGRVRSAIQSDQRFLASDIIFADAVTGTQQITESLQAARDAERAALEATLERDRVLQLALFPAAVILVLASAWLAGSSSRPRSTARSEAEELAQMLRELPPAVKAPGVTAATAPPVATPPSRPAVPVPAAAQTPVAPVVPAINLSDAAELCVDLARVMDARDMPSLLQRAARTLDATGIIVWVIDTRGSVLTPALAHGYPDRVLAKLGTLDVSADNVTSLSFRSMRPQAMPGSGNGNSSAIAVPMVTTEGCNGVFSAEVPGAKPSEECVAMARILAAQLASMLTPLEPSAQRAAEA